MQTKVQGERYTEYIPVRMSKTMKTQLTEISRRSAARNIADHIRRALELYIEANTPITPEEASQGGQLQ